MGLKRLLRLQIFVGLLNIAQFRPTLLRVLCHYIWEVVLMRLRNIAWFETVPLLIGRFWGHQGPHEELSILAWFWSVYVKILLFVVVHYYSLLILHFWQLMHPLEFWTMGLKLLQHFFISFHAHLQLSDRLSVVHRYLRIIRLSHSLSLPREWVRAKFWIAFQINRLLGITRTGVKLLKLIGSSH